MAVGGVSAIVHYLIYIALLKLGIPYNISYAIGFSCGIICNFYGSNIFTFKTKPTFRRAIKFAISNGINFLNHLILLNLSIIIGISEEIAPAVVYTIAFPINFILVRYALRGKIKK